MGFTLSVITGLVMGLIFGDLVFPELKVAHGTPHTEIVLGLAGAIITAVTYEIIAAVLYEIATHLRDRT